MTLSCVNPTFVAICPGSNRKLIKQGREKQWEMGSKKSLVTHAYVAHTCVRWRAPEGFQQETKVCLERVPMLDVGGKTQAPVSTVLGVSFIKWMGNMEGEEKHGTTKINDTRNDGGEDRERQPQMVSFSSGSPVGLLPGWL